MGDPLVQLPDGDWVPAGDVSQVSARPNPQRGPGTYVLAVEACDGRAWAKEYPDRAEAEAARDALALTVNAALAVVASDASAVDIHHIRHAVAQVREGIESGWSPDQIKCAWAMLDLILSERRAD